jgi:ankyrin repeat protein
MYAITLYDETPMMAACKNNHNGIVEHLLVHGVSEVLLAKVRASHGTVVTTPLHEVVRNGNEYLVNVLLSHGAAVDERNDKQETALHLATNCNIAECLLKRGAQINAATVDGETPLYVACQRGSVDLVDMLLQYGAEPNGQSGTIPLSVHCQKDNGSFSGTLLSNGADRM